VIYDRKTGELYEADTSPNSGPARGEFDGEGNYWSAGRGGSLIKFDIKTKRVHEYPLPTPYTSLYTARADKNGEVWAGELNGGRYLRFDPKTETFTRLYAARTVQHGPAILDRQFHQSSLGLVRRPRWLAGAHSAAR